MGEEDISPSKDGKNEEKTTGQHKKNQNSEDQTEEERKGGMNIFQPNHWNIPEEKNKEEKDQASQHQKPDEDPLFRFSLQYEPLILITDCEVRNAE